MGADPTALVIGLGMPADMETAWLDALTDGFREECDLVGASVAGGDIARSDVVVIGVTALGDLGGRSPVTRSGARQGQIVAIAGRLGHAAAGLALLQAGFADDGALAPGLRSLIEAHRRPRPPYACGPEAAALGATGMLDVSDGLLQDLGHVAEASGVGIWLDPARLPVPEVIVQAAAALGADPLEWILTGGDDHALAATFPEHVRLPPAWTPIGRVTDGKGVHVEGRTTTSGGWDHFRG
jgi:thiamine-monophosphate kinase